MNYKKLILIAGGVLLVGAVMRKNQAIAMPQGLNTVGGIAGHNEGLFKSWTLPPF